MPKDNMPAQMPLIGDNAPKFTAETTKGKIHFPHDFKGKWVVFFSHPADFTPVCTTEFIAFQKVHEDFHKINTELIGLSVDDMTSHKKWLKTIEEKINFDEMTHTQINFPLIDDKNLEIASKYGMIHPQVNNTKTVRAVFIIDPVGIIRAILYYPLTNGRFIPEIIRLVTALQVTDCFNVATPANWLPGDDVIIPIDQKVYELSPNQQQNEGIHCYDWFLCVMKLSKDDINKKISKNKYY